MQAMKNLTHAVILAGWALLGLGLTFKLAVEGPMLAGLLTAATYWLWLAGLAAVTSLFLSKAKSPLVALAVHSGAFVVMALLPRVFPLNVFRLGLDLLSRA